MTVGQAVLLMVAAAVAGMLNSVAGGGSFLTFPTLLFTGVGPIEANASSTVALWPGSAASAAGYRQEVRFQGRETWWLGVPSLLGGVLGALLLVRTPPETFIRVLPLLLMLATLMFSFGDRLRRRIPARLPSWVPSMVPSALLQLLIAIYGGYFGGGMGLMMLAAMTLAGLKDIHHMNGVKNILAVLINGLAVVTFAAAGKVLWPQALVMMVGAVVGGYGGARVARRLSPALVRGFVIAVGWGLTAIFVYRSWLAA